MNVRPIIVLLHGWGMNARVFDALAARLAGGFDVHAADLPGHGGRAPLAANTLAAWADDLAHTVPDGATLVGWSLGGQVALRAAIDHPQRIARLVLLATTPRFVAGAGWAHGIAAADLDAFGAALLTDPEATLLRFLSLQTRGMDDQRALLQQLRQTLFAAQPADPAALAAGLDILRTTDLRAELPRIAQPTLVLHGALDTLTPPGAGASLAAALPHAQHVAIARAAHAPHLSHPEAVAAALGGFVRGE